MGRAVLTLYGDAERAKAALWLAKAPPLTRVEFKGPARSTDQNALMWELLTQLADQHRWHGIKLTAEDYKDLLTASLRREVRTVPNTDGTGFVVLGMRTSDMSREEMSNLIDLIYAFATRVGVTFSAAPVSPDKSAEAREGARPADDLAPPPERSREAA